MDWKELAAQKLNISSKCKKTPSAKAQRQESCVYPTGYSSLLRESPPAVPLRLLRELTKGKDNSTVGKAKVTIRLWSFMGPCNSFQSASFLKVDSRKKQLTLCDPASSGQNRSATVKMFPFDSIFSQDASQAEVCSGTMGEVIQSVVNGADGCIFCFGQSNIGKTYTMIGKDISTQHLGIIPCAISWLFKLISEHEEVAGTCFSVHASAVEIFGRAETLRDLLYLEAHGDLPGGSAPEVHLQDDPICGSQLLNHSVLHAATAEEAAHFLDAALATRSTNGPLCDEADRCNSHLLFTLHVSHSHIEKSSKLVVGGRSRLHLIDLGSGENTQSQGGKCDSALSLTAIGNVIIALVNGAKNVPHRDSKLTMLLRESLGNVNCRITMIAHISDCPVHYQESLITIQLASRVHRIGKKKSKYLCNGGESFQEEGHRYLKLIHPHNIALSQDISSLPSYPGSEYYSCSKQPCDAVIYTGPKGTTISGWERSKNKGPQAFVPIIPSLNKKLVKRGSSVDGDHFKCNTFAELQECLECMDGKEGYAIITGETKGSQTRKPEGVTAPSPRTTKASSVVAGWLAGNDMSHFTWPNPSDNRESSACFRGTNAEIGRDNHISAFKHGKPMLHDSNILRKKVQIHPSHQTSPRKKIGNIGRQESLPSIIPSAGMSHYFLNVASGGYDKVKHAGVGHVPPTSKSRQFDRDILRTTVTLKKPIELNGEDELVFTVVEELPIAKFKGYGHSSHVHSPSKECSLKTQPSESHRVSIIASINDEYDAYVTKIATPLQAKPSAWYGSKSTCFPEISKGSLESKGGHYIRSSIISPSKYSFPVGSFNFDYLSQTESNNLPERKVSIFHLDKYSTMPQKITKCHVLQQSESAKALAHEHYAAKSKKTRSTQNLQSQRVFEMQKPAFSVEQGNCSSACELQIHDFQVGGSWIMFNSLKSSKKKSHSCSRLSQPGACSNQSKKHSSSSWLSKTHLYLSPQKALGNSQKSDLIKIVSVDRHSLHGETMDYTASVTNKSSDFKGNREGTHESRSLKMSWFGRKGDTNKGNILPKSGSTTIAHPPLQHSSLGRNKGNKFPVGSSKGQKMSKGSFIEEEHLDPTRAFRTSSLKTNNSIKRQGSPSLGALRDGKQHSLSSVSLERCETSDTFLYEYHKQKRGAGLVSNAKSCNLLQRTGITTTAASSPTTTSDNNYADLESPSKLELMKSFSTKSVGIFEQSSEVLSSNSTKPLSPAVQSVLNPTSWISKLPPNNKVPVSQSPAGVVDIAGTSLIMDTKQAMRTANSHISGLSLKSSRRLIMATADSDSGNDSSTNLSDEKSSGGVLASPYSKITAPRHPQHYSSGHGSDISSVLSGELPPAMDRTTLFYHSEDRGGSGRSSGYGTLIRNNSFTRNSTLSVSSDRGLKVSNSPRKRTKVGFLCHPSLK